MATYWILVNWTEQGIKNVKESPRRLDAGRELAQKFGVELKDFYMTIGPYDMLTRVEAPGDDAVAKFVLALSSGGNVRTITLKAFPEAQYREIIKALP
jgi:uncharacterized protein with GYD domain